MIQTLHKNIIALSCGDLNSIAPFITLKAWLELKDTTYKFVLLSNANYMKKVIEYFELNITLTLVDNPKQAYDVFSQALPIIDINYNVENFLGDKTPANAQITMQSLDNAIELCKNNKIKAFCTNPLDKNIINQYLQPKFYFKGHTEYIANALNKTSSEAKPLMILSNISQSLRVLPATTHIPLNQVANTISKSFLVDILLNLHNSLIKQFHIAEPKIGVLGLNPHCGDGGIMGMEEIEFINDAIEEAKILGINVFGCIPADTAFTPQYINKYDCIVGMYHDQVLTPFKTLYFDDGVNITANLEYIRTSPDHGVAFDIAKTTLAKPNSLINAIKLAHHMIDNK